MDLFHLPQARLPPRGDVDNLPNPEPDAQVCPPPMFLSSPRRSAKQTPAWQTHPQLWASRSSLALARPPSHLLLGRARLRVAFLQEAGEPLTNTNRHHHHHSPGAAAAAAAFPRAVARM